ncbi:MAG: DUF4199 domain-containing protein [Cyclobacteriaceae bacterium]|nr:DUF4199 domain-containing protein [Cyclobacteriaceae bacterium]MCH8516727.1 DUF4199 domain-containing protein [Cyclobacteriaceae bacterium]
MNFENKLLRTGVKYGIAASALYLLGSLILIFFEIDIYHQPMALNILYFITPIFMAFGIHEFKKVYNGGLLAYWEGMSVSFFTYFIVSVLIGIYTYALLSVIYPSLIDVYVNTRIDMLVEKRENVVEEFGVETYEYMKESIKEITPWQLTMDFFWRQIGIALFFAIVFSVIFRRTNRFVKKSDVAG